MNKRKNQPIEFFRLFASIMVVFIHAHFPGPFGKYIDVLGRFAVPFFLLVSGYYSLGSNEIQKTKKKLIDVAKIIFFGGMTCLIWNSVNSYFQFGSPFIWLSQYIRWGTIFSLVIFNRAVFFNSVFYYFFMITYVYLIHLVLLKKGINTNKGLYIVIFLLALGWIIDHFTSLQWFYYGNALLTGVPLFYLGRFMHLNTNIVSRTKGFELILIIVGSIISILEYLVLPCSKYTYIGQVFVAMMIICYCINHSDSKVFYPFVWFGTSCSIYLLIIHHQVIKTLSIFINDELWFFPLVVLTISCALSIFITFSLNLFRMKFSNHNSN